MVDRGQRLGLMSRAPQRDENDAGLCSQIITTGDFDGDGRPEIILAPRGVSREPTVVLSLKGGSPAARSEGVPFNVVDPAVPADAHPAAKWAQAQMTAFDWDGDGRLDLIAAVDDNDGYWLDPETGVTPENQRDRYTADGRWVGKPGRWSLHLLRNTGTAGRPEFTYVRQIELPTPPPGGPLSPLRPQRPHGRVALAQLLRCCFSPPTSRSRRNSQLGQTR